MRKPFEFVVRTTVGGLLIIVPVYLAVLLVLKGMATVGRQFGLAISCRTGSAERPYPAVGAADLFLIGVAVNPDRPGGTKLGGLLRAHFSTP
jgi:hypothetical protein